jgi:hypothetical protein
MLDLPSKETLTKIRAKHAKHAVVVKGLSALPESYITLRQAAKRLEISKHTLEVAADSGKLDIKLHPETGSRMVDLPELERWYAKSRAYKTKLRKDA